MQAITIRPCAVADVERSGLLPEIVSAYRAESGVGSVGVADPDFDAYAALEDRGVLHPIGVFCGDDLVGVAFVIVHHAPHYRGKLIATTESIFVLPEYRRYGTGARLLDAARDLARAFGATSLIVSAPSEGRLAKVLPHRGYAETNRLFVLSL